jgi:diketogulonate reductase-like aldo/keto reductase
MRRSQAARECGISQPYHVEFRRRVGVALEFRRGDDANGPRQKVAPGYIFSADIRILSSTEPWLTLGHYTGPLSLIPQRTLYTGATMPAIGLGTFGSDHVSAGEVAEAVKDAIEIGYRHLDCASVYRNEHAIGPAIEDAIQKAGITRDNLWITSKLWNDQHSRVLESCRQSLADLRLEHLDMYLVHWPFPNFHPPGCSVDSRSPDARPYIHDDFMKTWREMEKLVDRGLTRHVGTSNMTIPKLKLLLRDARIKPAVNEMELHPHFQQPGLFDFVRANGIEPIGYSPLGSPGRPDRDRTPGDTVDIEDPVILAIAQRLGIHPAAVCIKWAVQRGQTPIPFSVKRRNYAANLECLKTEPLTEADMLAIAGIDKGCRLIKGQVFLWKDNQSWEDLWDLDGVVKT